MNTPGQPRQPRPGKLGSRFLDGIDAPKPKRELATASAEATSEQETAPAQEPRAQRGSATGAPAQPAPTKARPKSKPASTERPTSQERPAPPQPPTPADPDPASPVPQTAGAKIRRTAFLPPELIARVKLAIATNGGGTYTFVTLQAVGELHEQGRLTQVVTAYASNSRISSTAGSSLFPDLTTRTPARPKAQFPLHLTAGQLTTLDALKDEIGVDRSLFVEAVLDATMPR